MAPDHGGTQCPVARGQQCVLEVVSEHAGLRCEHGRKSH